MKRFIIISICFLVIFPVVCCGYYLPESTEYVWSENTVQTIAEDGTQADFLDLSCESAILIEQTTRGCSL